MNLTHPTTLAISYDSFLKSQKSIAIILGIVTVHTTHSEAIKLITESQIGRPPAIAINAKKVKMQSQKKAHPSTIAITFIPCSVERQMKAVCLQEGRD
jgi:hypothetical protein